MTKLRWDKAGRYEPDPGTVVVVPDTAQRWTPPQERKRKEAKRAKEQRALRERSLEHDRKLSEPGAVAAILAKKRKVQPSGIHALIERVLGKRQRKLVEKPE